MQRAALSLLLSCLSPGLLAQGSLADLQRQFGEQMRQLGGGKATREQQAELRDRQTRQLQQFLADQARGDDRWNGRLMLADFQLSRDDDTGAAATLRSIDADAAPALLLVSAATMAQHLNLRDLRDAWIKAASTKKAPPADRLAMARLLMSVLHEVEAGEKVFAAALAEATDDEQRALVRWHRADALRDREDLPDNAAFEELEKLANDLPKTYWGDVAKDRLRATRLQVGDDAIAWRARTRAGKELGSAELLGKAIVLAFWSAGDMDLPTLVSTMRQLQQQYGPALVVIGVCLDRDDDAIGAAVKERGIDFPVVGNGKGVLTDLALRWFVEGPTIHIIDKNGKIAGLGLHVGTVDSRAEIAEVVARACKS
ncbi:MAG TPA: TlpA disulfide reductase family protein [Planctomycetota bacterium]|nr:TlpA disulfide reductase family protein [Planctomycetota bacterium]